MSDVMTKAIADRPIRQGASVSFRPSSFGTSPINTNLEGGATETTDLNQSFIDNLSGRIADNSAQILSGSEDPAADLGSEKDIYINTQNNTLFVKSTDGWGSGIQLGGGGGEAPAGIPGLASNDSSGITVEGNISAQGNINSNAVGNFTSLNINGTSFTGSFNDLNDVPNFVIEDEYTGITTNILTAETVNATNLNVGGSGVSSIAFSGSYNDLIDVPNFVTADDGNNISVNDVNFTGSISSNYIYLNAGNGDISCNTLTVNGSGLTNLALTASYNDLVDVPAVDWSTITGDQAYINVSAFTNDANYISGIDWPYITGDQSAVNVGGFNNDANYVSTDGSGYLNVTGINLTEKVNAQFVEITYLNLFNPTGADYVPINSLFVPDGLVNDAGGSCLAFKDSNGNVHYLIPPVPGD